MNLRCILAGVTALRSSHRAVPAVLSSRALGTTGTALQAPVARVRHSTGIDLADAKSALSTSATATTTPRPIARKRASTVFSYAPIDTWNPLWRPFGARQELEDARNDAYTPDLTTNYENIPRLGRLTLRELIEVGHRRAMFAVVEYPDLVVEYQLQPIGLGFTLLGLLRDHWIRTELARRGRLLDAPIFISPTAKTRTPYENAGRKTFHIGLTGQDLDFCGADGALVRFAVRKRIGECLRHDAEPVIPGSERMSIHRAAAIGVQVIEFVAGMHRVGIMHGNIHDRNVCYTNAESSKVTLINFGHSQWTEMETDKAQFSGFMDTKFHMTPWQVAGSRPARRDDVYRTLELVAALIVGPDLYKTASVQFLADSESSFKSFKKWKSDPEAMLKSSDRDPVDALAFLTMEQKELVRSEFAEAMKTVLALESVKTPIDYPKIVRHLRNIENLTTPPVAPVVSDFAA